MKKRIKCLLGNAGFNTSSVDGISMSNIASAKTTSNIGKAMSSIGNVASNLGPIGMAAGTALKTFGGVFSASGNNKLAREQQRIMTKTKLDTENELIRQEHLNDEDVNNNYIAGKFGSNFKCGGKIKAKRGGKSKLKLGALGINTKDGNAIPITSNTKQMFLLRGKSHEEGGIKQGKNLEVEDGEVEYLSNDGKTLNVLSDQSYLTRRGISPADLAIITGNPETAMKEQESVKSQLGIKDSKYKAGKGKKYVIKANDGLQTEFDFLSTDDIINKINNQWNNYKDRNPLNENLNFSINNNVKLPDYSLSKRRSNVDYISLLNANKDNNNYPLANVDVSLLQQARKLGNDYPTAPVIGQTAEQYNEELKSYINNKTIVKNAIPKNPALLEVKPKTAIEDTDKVLHEKEYIIPQIPNREAELQPEKTMSQIEKEQSDKLKPKSLMNLAPYMSSATESLLNYGINNSEIKSRLQPNAPIYNKAVINNANVNINDQLADANNTFRKNQGIIYANSVNSKAAASRLINANSITDAAKQAAYKNKYDTEKQIRESNQVNATNIINSNNQLVHTYLNDVRDFKNTQNGDIAKNKVNLNKNINALVHDIDNRKQTLKKEELDRAITIGKEAGTNNNSMTYFLGTALFDENTPEGYNNTLAYYNSIKDNNDENSILMKNKLEKRLNIK